MENGPKPSTNRFQLAIEVLQKGREVLMQDLADHIIDREEDFIEGGFLFQEFLENQGSKLHFLYLMLSQLEQSSEQFEDSQKTTNQYEEPAYVKFEDELIPESFDLGKFTDLLEIEEAREKAEKQPPKKPRKRKSKKIEAKSSLPSPSDEGE